MRRLVSLLALVTALATSTACAVHVHQRDDATIAAIGRTAAHRAEDAARVAEALAFVVTRTADAADAPRVEALARELAARERAEQVRLSSWKWAEEQKEPAR